MEGLGENFCHMGILNPINCFTEVVPEVSECIVLGGRGHWHYPGCGQYGQSRDGMLAGMSPTFPSLGYIFKVECLEFPTVWDFTKMESYKFSTLSTHHPIKLTKPNLSWYPRQTFSEYLFLCQGREISRKVIVPVQARPNSQNKSRTTPGGA